MAREDLIEFVDDAVSWMVAAKKSHPTLLLPAWVAQWQENRPTPLAVDETHCACQAEAFINDETPGCCGNCGKPFRH